MVMHIIEKIWIQTTLIKIVKHPAGSKDRQHIHSRAMKPRPRFAIDQGAQCGFVNNRIEGAKPTGD